MQISVMNNKNYTSPRLAVMMYELNSSSANSYITTLTEPKVVIDLTAELTSLRLGEEILFAQFPTAEYQETPEIFYKDCVNILSNVFISYTYED
jgi:hypothetical protein